MTRRKKMLNRRRVGRKLSRWSSRSVNDYAVVNRRLTSHSQLQTNLIASAVSSDGKWLAVSDLYETKLFRLQIVRPLLAVSNRGLTRSST